MNQTNQLRQNDSPRLNEAGKKRIIVVLTTYALIFGAMFWAAGTINWPLAWIYTIITVIQLFDGGHVGST